MLLYIAQVPEWEKTNATYRTTGAVTLSINPESNGPSLSEAWTFSLMLPDQAIPAWMRVIAAVDPFTCAAHGFKELLLKGTRLAAILPDLFYLGVFSAIAMGAATLLFRRTL